VASRNTREVGLVVRAKNEAEKVLDAITAALNDFRDAERGVTQDSAKTRSALSLLGTALSDFQKAASSDPIGKLADSSARAAAQVARVQQEIEGTKKSLKEYQQDLKKAGDEITKVNGKLETAKTKLAATRVEQEKSAAAVKKIAAAQTEALGRQEKYAKAVEKTQNEITRLTGKIDGYQTKVKELGAQIAAAEAPTQRLLNSFKSNTTALIENSAKLRDQKEALKNSQAGLDRANVSVAKYTDGLKTAEAALKKSNTALDKSKTTVKDLQVVARSAADAESKLASTVEKTANSLNRQNDALGKNKAALAATDAALAETTGRMAEFGSKGFGNLRLDIGAQVRQVREARDAMAATQVTVDRLVAEIGAVGVPTLEMAKALDVVKVRALESKEALRLETETLGRLRQALAAAGGDASKLSSAQAAFASIHAGSDAALAGVRQNADKSRTALERLYDTYLKVAQATRIAAAAPPVPPPQQLSLIERITRALLGLNNEHRTSLSVSQRLRGEVLSLVAAYGGFYGVISVLGQTVDAFQQLEAAQARLNVATGDDQEQTAAELDFVRRNAERLGIEFGTLATEYSKFAIATKGTNLAGENTRKIFIAVAEAARVNRSSAEDMKGVFTALTQIVSKGAVQMEELRQQLGDRLPGAINLMADGLGIGTDELIKMMEQGQITSDALIPFAEELTKRFGPGLEQSLIGVTAAIGQLKNAAFQALLTFGKGGFIDAFAEFARMATEVIKSADFQTFLGALSKGFAALFNVLGFVVQNFRLLIAAVTAYASISILPLVLKLAKGVQTLGVAFALAGESATKAAIAARTTGTAFGAGAAGVTAFGVALKSLLITSGVGIAFVAITTAISLWATAADQATEAMNLHEKIVDRVRNAYDQTGASVDRWREKLQGVTLFDARKDVDDLTESLEDAKGAFKGIGGVLERNIFGNVGRGQSKVVQEFLQEVDALFQRFDKGEIKSDAFAKGVDELIDRFREADPAVVRMGESIIESATNIDTYASALEVAKDVVIALTGTADEAEAAIKRLNGETENAADPTDALGVAMDALSKSVKAVAEFAPKSKEGTEDIAKAAYELQRNYQLALLEVNKLPEAIMRAAAMQDLLNKSAEGFAAIAAANAERLGQGFGGDLVDRIIGGESAFDPNAKNPDSSATGLGQFIASTWLEMFKKYFPDRAEGMTNTMILALRTDAALSRQMTELYLRENAALLDKAGVAITDANLKLAHFLGPGGAIALVNSAPGTIANDVLGADQIAANQSILDGKTREEVIAWAERMVGVSGEELSVRRRLVEIDQERADEIIKQADAAIKASEEAAARTAGAIADGEFAVEQQERKNAGLEREAAIQAAINAAKKQNANISQAELATIAEQAGRLFDLEQANKNILTTKEQAQKAEEEVNNLISIRQALTDQLALAAEAGDSVLQDQIKAKIVDINATLNTAIESAIKFWEAVGGTESEAAIANLRTLSIEARNFGQAANASYFTWKKVGELFMGGVASAFDTFAQKLVETGNLFESLGYAFQKFAAEFLIEIGKMIIQQAIFNALKGTAFGNFLGIGIAHKGEVVGRSSGRNQRRMVSPMVFMGARRFHGGGLPGLAPNEVPIIAKKNEEVLSENDPRNVLNGGKAAGGSSQAPVNIRNINVSSPEEGLQAALDTPAGERAILNFIGKRSSKVRAAIER
jgi:tape measure domain-containing protein